MLGTLYALAGSVLAAVVGYGLGRFLGRPFAVRWIGEHLQTGERAFARYGGWIVAASRWMPVLPEVISVCAGFSRMPFLAFLVAVFCGALPHCAAFAVIGHLGADTPIWTVLISALIPILLWLLAVWTGLTQRLGLQVSR
jgi:membrane protein DedA with SNARE-associated domain